jgi:hypothetical protein
MMNPLHFRPARSLRPSLRIRPLAVLAATFSLLWLAASGTVAATQPPKIRTCSVAVVDKDLLTINCPKARLGELLAALHEQTGMESDVSAELAATPISVALEKSTLQVALDMMLARFNYSLDGTPIMVGGRAGGTKVVVLGLREAAAQDKRNSAPMATPPTTAEPSPSRYQEEPPPPPPESAADDAARPGAAEPQTAEAPGFAPGMPAMDPELAAKAREAFFAKLPAAGATLPPGAAQVELPPSRPIQNNTGPGDGRKAMPLPDFTPGPPTQTPPGMSQ